MSTGSTWIIRRLLLGQAVARSVRSGAWQTWAPLARAQVLPAVRISPYGFIYGWPEELVGSTTRLQASPRSSRGAALGACLSAQSSACASALVSCSVERRLRSSSISLCEGPVKTGHGLRCASRLQKYARL